MNFRRIALPLAAAAAALITTVGAQAAPLKDVRLGELVSTTEVERVIAIGADTRWVNVQHGETVRFLLAGGHSFTVDFNGIANSFDLNQVAPAGLLSQRVIAYVEQDHEN